jgi:hypothetical protein
MVRRKLRVDHGHQLRSLVLWEKDMLGLDVSSVMEMVPSAGVAGVSPGLSKVDATSALGPLKDSFSAALSKAFAADQANPAAPPVRLAAAEPQTMTDAAASPVDAAAEAQGRARQALKLNPSPSVKPVVNGGDKILEGLSRIRSEFDAHTHRLQALMAQRTSDVKTVFAVQEEVAHFGLLVDVTSKLTGKSTQALEALLKG